MNQHIYLVKKDPNLPGADDNWICMNYAEYCRFLETPEGQKRVKNFAQLDACEEGDDTYTIECDIEKAKEIRSEKDAKDYRDEVKAESGYTTISYHVDHSEGNDITEEDLLRDELFNTEKLAIKHMTAETVREVLSRHSPADRHLLRKLVQADRPWTVRIYAKITHSTVRIVAYRRDKLFKLLRVQLKRCGIRGCSDE